jgi:hypothetical protein
MSYLSPIGKIRSLGYCHDKAASDVYQHERPPATAIHAISGVFHNSPRSANEK